MKYVIYAVIAGAIAYNFLMGGMDLSIVDDLKAMIPATPEWLSNLG